MDPLDYTIGFVGLGAMGSRIAARLLESGHQVYGTNRTRAKAETLVERGLVWRDTPREVTEAAEVIFSMVTDDAALEAINSGSDGILAGLAPGKVYVDMSTVSPHVSRELAERVWALGAEMLDAPVSGSLPAAEGGSLTIMVGGGEEPFTQVEPILQELGATVTRIGENGQALLLKLAVNISLAVQMLAFSEGVLLAERGGIDRALAVDVLTQSAVGSPMLKSRGPFVLAQPETPLFDVGLMSKDLDLAFETAGALDAPLPTATVARELFTDAGTMGYEHKDIAAIYDVLAKIGRE
ncbi:MAG TPA: NAD(P)-dependent oxidoreductase [Gaiellaceae bacterium]|nr:NAD(P)-dependent oxidoreductase [Gaiellaceae bacterium]